MENAASKRWRCFTVHIWLALFMVVGFAFAAHAETQVVTFSPEEVVVLSAESAELALDYSVSDGEKQTTGLGVRIHYNSSAIFSLSLQDPYWESLIAQDEEAQDDVDDLDNDPLTDKYIGIAWMNLTGDWPKFSEFPTELARVVLEIRADSGVPVTRLNITSSSTPAGYQFEGKSAAITIP